MLDRINEDYEASAKAHPGDLYRVLDPTPPEIIPTADKYLVFTVDHQGMSALWSKVSTELAAGALREYANIMHPLVTPNADVRQGIWLALSGIVDLMGSCEDTDTKIELFKQARHLRRLYQAM